MYVFEYKDMLLWIIVFGKSIEHPNEKQNKKREQKKKITRKAEKRKNNKVN